MHRSGGDDAAGHYSTVTFASSTTSSPAAARLPCPAPRSSVRRPRGTEGEARRRLEECLATPFLRLSGRAEVATPGRCVSACLAISAHDNGCRGRLRDDLCLRRTLLGERLADARPDGPARACAHYGSRAAAQLLPDRGSSAAADGSAHDGTGLARTGCRRGCANAAAQRTPDDRAILAADLAADQRTRGSSYSPAGRGPHIPGRNTTRCQHKAHERGCDGDDLHSVFHDFSLAGE